MAISLPLVVLVLLRTGYLRLGPALACALFVFCLASTGIAPANTNAINSVTGWVSSL